MIIICEILLRNKEVLSQNNVKQVLWGRYWYNKFAKVRLKKQIIYYVANRRRRSGELYEE